MQGTIVRFCTKRTYGTLLLISKFLSTHETFLWNEKPKDCHRKKNRLSEATPLSARRGVGGEAVSNQYILRNRLPIQHPYNPVTIPRIMLRVSNHNNSGTLFI